MCIRDSLYADNQKTYTVTGNQTGYDAVAASTITLTPTLNSVVEDELSIDENGNVRGFVYRDSVNKIAYYWNVAQPSVAEGWRTAQIASNGVTVYVNGVKSTAVTEPKLVETTADGYMPVRVNVDASGVVSFGVGSGYSTSLKAGGTVTGPNIWTRTANGSDYYNNTAIEKYATVTYDQVLAKVGSTAVNGSTIWVPFEDVVTTVSNQNVLKSGVTVQVSLPAVAAVNESLGTIVGENHEGSLNNFVNTVAHGHYTGNIDKNWSINLIEKSSGVAELIANAELYKADEADYLSYNKYTTEIMPNAVYLKITLEDEWKTVDEETLTYYVYIADNDSNSKTNEVWVSGNYANNNYEYVDFDWTNNASKAKLWKVRKGENGTAVFDFADKAFFTVKMYSGESMYLDLSTAYDKAIAGEMDAEADSFYKFDNDNANFSRTGELIIVTDDSSLVPYEIDEDGNFVEVDAKYVEDYAIAHTNKKVDGFVFSTKTLGNYVLSTEELGQEEPVDETPVVEEPTTETLSLIHISEPTRPY